MRWLGKLGRGQFVLTGLVLFAILVAGVSVATSLVIPPTQTSDQDAPGGAEHDDDPLAAEKYLESLRQAPKGTSPAKARQDALARVTQLPKAKNVPAAKSGKGTKIEPGRDLASPFGQWHQLGPAPIDHSTVNPNFDFVGGLNSGRGTSVVVGPNTGVIYLGTASGGVWKSTDDGANWTALLDNEPSLAVGSLALDPTDTTDQTLYVGTGEVNYDLTSPSFFNGDNYFGVGVLKTTDGGAHWTPQGQDVFGAKYNGSSFGIGAMAANGSTVFAGTTNGMYSNTNGGTGTWSPVTVATSSPTARVTNVIIDGANVYAVLSTAQGGSAAAGVYKSTSGGADSTFQPKMTGLPAGSGWGRAAIAIAPSSPPTLYLAIADGSGSLLGIYKTVNGGDSWQPTTKQPSNYFQPKGAAGPQGYYDTFIAVDPTDVNIVYAGGIDVVMSTNGGGSWSTVADVYCSGAQPPNCTSVIHPDQHAAAFARSGPTRAIYVANDGGLYKGTRSGDSVSWTSLNSHIAATQFYWGDSAANYVNTGVVAGAAQDNGISRFSSYGAYGKWNAVGGGDGTFVAVSKQDATKGYTSRQNGDLFRASNMDKTGTALTLTELGIGSLCQQKGTRPNFVAPQALDPRDDQHLLFGGGGRVCESIDGGSNYSINQVSLGSPIQSVAFATNSQVAAYAGTDSGTVWRTTNAYQKPANAATWSQCAAGGLPAQPVTSIATDPFDPDTVYVTLAGFGNGHIYKVKNCTNASATWQALNGSGTYALPDAPVQSIVVYYGTGSNVLIAGGDVGVFVSEDEGRTWNNLNNQLPASVPIMHLFTDPSLTTLFAATHGRGMWEIPIPAFSSADISFDHDPLDFGSQPVSTTANQTLTVTDTGTAPIVFRTTSFTGAPSFTKVSDTCQNATVQVGQQCSVVVSFAPTIPGSYVADITFSTNLANPNVGVHVTGTGNGVGAATFSPAGFGYGGRAVNTDNLQTFGLQNTGSGTLNVTSVGITAVSGGGGAFSINVDNCSGHALNPNDSCFLNVNFRPVNTQSYSATLDFTDDAQNSPQHIQMTGSGISAIQFTPGDIDFGTRDVNVSGGVPRTLTITNVSANPITFGATDVTVAGVNSGDFTITANSCANSTVNADSACHVDVQFKPLDVGARQGRITVHVGSNETPFMSLEGNGVNGAAAAVTVNPNPVTFTDTLVGPGVGTYRNYMYVTVQNTGVAPLQNVVAQIDTNAADDHADFGIDYNPCGAGLTLPPGGLCRMYMHFIPTALGARHASLVIASNAPGSPMTVPVSGNGIDPNTNQKAYVGVSAITDFGSQPLNNTAQANFAIRSWGNIGFTVDQITLAADSPNPGDFQVINQFACEITYSESTGANPYCQVDVYFTPQGPGLRQAYIDVTFLNGGAPAPVRLYLQGTGLAPALTLDKTKLDFGNVAIGSTVSQNVTITNSGTAPLYIQNIGSDGPHFGAYYPNCTTIQPNANCIIQIKYNPTSMGQDSANITITSNAPQPPQQPGQPLPNVIAVTGTGGQPLAVTVSTTADVVNPNDGKCSLREAIIAADTGAASGPAAGECPAGLTGGTITLAKGATYPLTIPAANGDDPTTGDLNILAGVSIVVANGGTATITAQGVGHVVTIGTPSNCPAPTVNLTGVILTGGNLVASTFGHSGGGLDIFCGTVNLTDVTVRNNSALGNGGGIALQGGELHLLRTTVSGNTGGTGGGIYQNGTMTVTTSTISGNTATSGNGGAIESHLDLAIISSTIAGNNTGIHNTSTTYPVFIQGTILSNTGANCTGLFSSSGYNMENGTSCPLTGVGDYPGRDPKLGALAVHGGLTPTHLLAADSPAIDVIPGTESFCASTTDQQGMARPVNGKCDIGATEYFVTSALPPGQPPGPPSSGPAPAPNPPSQPSAPVTGNPAPLPADPRSGQPTGTDKAPPAALPPRR